MIEDDNRSMFLKCDCTQSDHLLEVRLDTEWYDGEPAIVFNPLLNPRSSLFYRVWVGLRYIFGKSPRYSWHFDDVMIRDPDKIRDLNKLTSAAVAIIKIREKKV